MNAKLKMNAIGRMIGPAVFGAMVLGIAVSASATDTVSIPCRVIGPWGIRSSALSPDGKHLVVGATLGRLKLWNLSTSQETTIYDGVGDDISSVVYSPDGSKILTSRGQIRDVETGKVVLVCKDAFGPAVFSHDGTKIATGSPANDGTCRTILLLNASSGDTIRSFSIECQYVNTNVMGVAFSPDDSKILCGTDHTYNNGYHAGFVDIWDVASGNKIRAVLSGSNRKEYCFGVTSVAFSPDNDHFAVALIDTNCTAINPVVKIFSLSNDKQSVNVQGPAGNINTMTFSPDGSKLLTGSSKGTACLWSAMTGDSIRSFKGNFGEIISASFFPNGTKILTSSRGGNCSHVWDISTGDTLGTFLEPTWVATANMSAFTMSPDGSKFLGGTMYGGLTMWDAVTGNCVQTNLSSVSLSHKVLSMAYSPDGSKVIIGCDGGVAGLWNFPTNTLKEIRLPGEGAINSVAFLPDGSAFVTGSSDSTARLWNATTGDLIRTFRCNDLHMDAVAISPDNGKMWVGSGYSLGRHARLWNIVTGDSLLTIDLQSGIRKLAYSPDGTKLLVGTEFCTYLWDALTGKSLGTIDSSGYYTVSSVSFSHDGTKILVGMQNGKGGLWDAASGRCLRRFVSNYWMEDALFSPDDSMVISRSLDYIYLWDIRDVNTSILSKNTLVAPNTPMHLSVNRHTLSFSLPPATVVTRHSRLGIYQSNGRCVTSFFLQHAALNGRLTIALPQNIGRGLYMYRFSGVGNLESSGAFVVVK